MHIAIIGAGLSGLTCARRLQDQGHCVTVYEKSHAVSGRMSTRQTDLGGFDHGAQYFTASSAAFKNDVPRVIRPDILLTEAGFSITELDSVPGGIGLTGWLNQAYSRLAGTENPSATPHPPSSPQILGGAEGMLRGFESIFGDAKQTHMVVSEEAKTYRPEMEWLAAQLGARFTVHDAQFMKYHSSHQASCTMHNS